MKRYNFFNAHDHYTRVAESCARLRAQFRAQGFLKSGCAVAQKILRAHCARNFFCCAGVARARFFLRKRAQHFLRNMMVARALRRKNALARTNARKKVKVASVCVET